jgi:disulfide bond formation protein DsbB
LHSAKEEPQSARLNPLMTVMTSATATTSDARPLPLDKILVAIALVVGLATIAGAWGSQIFGGLVPCELCWGQRVPYYWGLPIIALVLILWNRLPLTVWYIGIAVAAAIFLWSAYLGGYHAGVEYGFWPGPTACTGTGNALDFNSLSTGNVERVVPCDAVQFRFLGITLAGYNTLISVGIVALLGAAMVFQARRAR